MKKFYIFTILTLFIFSVNTSASKNPDPKMEVQVVRPVLKGMIFDNVTKETLAGAVITVNGQKVYSDLEGNFSLSNLCDGKCTIKISMISYVDQTLEVDLKIDKPLQIKLQQR